MNPQSAREVLAQGVALLHSTATCWWLSSGTVLGIVREGLSDQWIEHDTDWDVSIRGGETERNSLRTLFLANGFNVHREYDKLGFPVQLCLIRNGILFDMYFWRETTAEPDLLVCDTEHGQMIKPLRFGRDRTLYNDYYLPYPLREYLFWRYGCDWHVPQTTKIPWQVAAPHLRKHRIE